MGPYTWDDVIISFYDLILSHDCSIFFSEKCVKSQFKLDIISSLAANDKKHMILNNIKKGYNYFSNLLFTYW